MGMVCRVRPCATDQVGGVLDLFQIADGSILVLKQERIYAQIPPWLVVEPTTNPELAAKRIAMLFGEEYLEQLTRACWDQCRQLPAMPAPVSKVVEQLRVRFNAHELYSIATIIGSDIQYQQFQQRW